MDKNQLLENLSDDVIRNIRKLLYYISIMLLGALASYSYMMHRYIDTRPINLIINTPACIDLPITWSQ